MSKSGRCPKCREELTDATQCDWCDWKFNDKATRESRLSTRNVGGRIVHRQCAWNDHGDNCDREGHLSQGTDGSGSWYCREHFGKMMGWGDTTNKLSELPRDESGFVDTPVVREFRAKMKTNLVRNGSLNDTWRTGVESE